VVKVGAKMVIIILAVVILFIVGLVLLISMKEEVLTVSKLRNVYLYLVSFVALMMILIGLIFTVQNITDVILPTNYYYDTMPLDKEGNITDADKKTYEENRKKNEENQNTQSKKNVAKSIAVVLVALPTFAYHWRKIQKEKKEQV